MHILQLSDRFKKNLIYSLRYGKIFLEGIKVQQGRQTNYGWGKLLNNDNPGFQLHSGTEHKNRKTCINEWLSAL